METQGVAKFLASDKRSATLHVPLARPIPKWVRWTFLLFVASIPLEALPIENITSDYLTLTKLFGLVFFTCYVLHSGLPLRLDVPPIPAAMWWFLAYLTVYALTGLSLEDEGIKGYIVRLLKLVQLFALFWLASGLLRDPSLAKKSMLTLAITCAGLAVGTLIGLPGFAPEASGRVTAFEFNPNSLASFMTVAAIIIIGFCLKETGWSAKRKLFLFAMTIPLFLVLVGTGSRSGIVSMVFAMSFYFVPHRGSKRQMLAFGVVLAAIAGIGFLVIMDPVASERWSRTVEGDSTNRGDIYAAALDMFAERPIAGWGGKAAFGELGSRLGMTSGHLDAHNAILYLLIEVGLLGTVPFLIALGLCARAAWKGRLDQYGLIPFQLIMAMFAYNLTHTALTSKVFFLFLGFGVAASSINRKLRYRWVASRTVRRPAETKEEFQPGVSVSLKSRT